MIARISAIALPFVAIVTPALAHRDGSTHTHPHLVVSNEWLAVLLMAAAVALVLIARSRLAHRTLRLRNPRGPK